jgi:electron transport complex protein RnfA
MDLFASMLNAALLAILLQNSIIERALGPNIMIYASRKKEHVVGFSLVITYTSTLSSVFAWVLDRYLSDFEHFGILMPLLYILVISAIYILSLIIIWRFFPKLFRHIKAYVHLSVFNCSVLGALFLNTQFGGDLASYIGFGIGTGLGFFFAGYLLYIAHPRLNSDLVPAAFRGLPITLVYIGIISLALYAFVGYATR